MPAALPEDDGPFWEYLPETGVEAIFQHGVDVGWAIACAQHHADAFHFAVANHEAAADLQRAVEHYGRKATLGVGVGGLRIYVEARA